MNIVITAFEYDGTNIVNAGGTVTHKKYSAKTSTHAYHMNFTLDTRSQKIMVHGADKGRMERDFGHTSFKERMKVIEKECMDAVQHSLVRAMQKRVVKEFVESQVNA